MKRRFFFKAVALAASLAALGSVPAYAQQKTVKVGVLHSLSGTMAISETALKDMALMTFDEINKKGGVMGYKIEPVVGVAAVRGLLENILFFARDPECVKLVFDTACEFANRVPVRRLTFVPDASVWRLIL